MDKDVYVGIDVSKTELVVAVRPSSESFTLAYHRAGLKQLVGRLGELKPKLVVVEATGGLQRQVVAALWTGGIAWQPSIRAGCGVTRGVADYWRRPTASMPGCSRCSRNAKNPCRGRRWMPRPRRYRNWRPARPIARDARGGAAAT